MSKIHILFLVPLIIGTLVPQQAPAEEFERVDGHFSSWEKVPEFIETLQLEKLHDLTRIKLGQAQMSKSLNNAEHEQHMLQTKQRWQQWWETTGKPVSELKKEHAKVDHAAFGMAWDFLGTKKTKPKEITPVWMPASWTLYVTFTNGDYGGREKEIWIIERKYSDASLTKLRGDYPQGLGYWSVTLMEFDDFTQQRADQVLKAICYLHLYAPESDEGITDNDLKRLYYPHATLRLRDGVNRILWNTEGYDFSKSRPKYGNGDPGRSYYFLRTVFSDQDKWKARSHPRNQILAPYRKFLSSSKPYFSANTADIIQLFGERGGRAELDAMFEWADKQKAAVDPHMGWEELHDDFGVGSKVNVINFTRSQIEATSKEISKALDRLERTPKFGQELKEAELESYRAKERGLKLFVSSMLALEKKEEEAEIQAFPQPLRSLIIADEHPGDHDLKHLGAAVQAIRDNPDPKLFAQLIQEMHEGTGRINSLLGHILLNEHGSLKLKEWGEKERDIAIEACITSLPMSKNSNQLVATILHVCGGGSIEYEGTNGGRRVEVILTENGRRITYGGASNPLPMKQAQDELRRIYREAMAK